MVNLNNYIQLENGDSFSSCNLHIYALSSLFSSSNIPTFYWYPYNTHLILRLKSCNLLGFYLHSSCGGSYSSIEFLKIPNAATLPAEKGDEFSFLRLNISELAVVDATVLFSFYLRFLF